MIEITANLSATELTEVLGLIIGTVIALVGAVTDSIVKLRGDKNK